MGTDRQAARNPGGGFTRWLREKSRVMIQRPADDLADLQDAIRREVRRSARRTLGGAVCYPTGAEIRMHPSDLALWRDFSAIIREELHTELRALADGDPSVRYSGCRVTAQSDDAAEPGRPIVEVDWMPITVDMRKPAATESGIGSEGSTIRGDSGGTRPGGGRSTASEPRGWISLDVPNAVAVPLPAVGGQPLGVGRSAVNAVRVPSDDMRASKRHAQIQCVGRGRWQISDLGSVNGTFVNDVPVESPVMLTHGSIIRIGASVLRVELSGARSQGGATESRRRL